MTMLARNIILWNSNGGKSGKKYFIISLCRTRWFVCNVRGFFGDSFNWHIYSFVSKYIPETRSQFNALAWLIISDRQITRVSLSVNVEAPCHRLHFLQVGNCNLNILNVNSCDHMSVWAFYRCKEVAITTLQHLNDCPVMNFCFDRFLCCVVNNGTQLCRGRPLYTNTESSLNFPWRYAHIFFPSFTVRLYRRQQLTRTIDMSEWIKQGKWNLVFLRDSFFLWP